MSAHVSHATDPQATRLPSETAHRHASTCFWDVERCRWECRRPR